MAMPVTRESVRSACQETLRQPCIYTLKEPSASPGVDGSPIETIGLQLFGAFQSESTAQKQGPLPWEVIEQAYISSARGVEAGITAYSSYVELSTGASFDTDMLHRALVDPRTAKFFTDIAGLKDASNELYEIPFGLRHSERMPTGDEFVFDPVNIIVVPEPELLLQTNKKWGRLGTAEIGDCPGRWHIPKVIKSIADIALERGLLKAATATTKK